jgi:hypothetical protein
MQIYYIFSSLWHNDIKGVLQNSPAKRKMMIGDACFAGSMIAPPVPTESDYADYYNDKDGIAFISASRRDETSAETNQLHHFLLRKKEKITSLMRFSR